MKTAFRAHMLVVGSDGEAVGSVRRIVGRHIELAGELAARVPLIWVAVVEAGQVRLDRPAEQALCLDPRAA